ncbi:Biopolymer transport protein ExbD [Pustulibacterium marinum]|uniref:Biopolymer transport protein ExbD n=1 Tax=Pustulibacterium marinum TaxID=1224947 RepID=A0A1I7HBD0_9FLAO|nr:biopolymer transporter ExbD [Pustulibacterium marinum]SFU58018.1 Biopolymer transport protein ExbD [Pustulibacterium marinum]
MAKRSAPEVNAGSMADIAFLLLIFFLVTTTIETNQGISTKLPPPQPPTDAPPPIKDKNVFIVLVNQNDELLVEEERMDIKDLREAALEFLDNGGDGSCSYCNGQKDPESSDNPNKAVISLRNNRETSYKTYIAVQNELIAAYDELRERERKRLYPNEVPYLEMDAEYNAAKTDDSRKDELQPKIEKLQALYPRKLSEAEPKKD